jgi:nitroimidazol reductase NimA-like FMN-containing flavoprotein (pyridoxamine 5'-phosphate oxidase superfamily)
MDWVDEGLEILSEDECRTLMATATVGRLAVTLGAVPVVMPVNFRLFDGDIVFATAEGTKLRSALAQGLVAFEVDEIDELAETGWSVLFVGEAREVTDPDELGQIRRLGVRPWVSGARDHWVRLEKSFVSGRRIVGDTVPPAEAGDDRASHGGSNDSAVGEQSTA